jgi:type IV pilus assembly protein PilX
MKEKGFILLIVMIFLVVMSMLGIVLFKGFISDENIAANMREKQRAIEAAQTGLDASQYWLGQSGNAYSGVWNTGVTCSATTQTGTTPTICSNALATPATLPWPSANTFQPPTMNVSTSGGSNTYAGNVQYYVQYVGSTSVNPPTAIYQVTSTAQGGNINAEAVLQGTYQVTASSRDISGG